MVAGFVVVCVNFGVCLCSKRVGFSRWFGALSSSSMNYGAGWFEVLCLNLCL
jgi:hypothetical protein